MLSDQRFCKLFLAKKPSATLWRKAECEGDGAQF